MTAAVIASVDLDAIKAVALSGNPDLELPAHDDVVVTFKAPETDESSEPETDEKETLHVPELGGDILSFDDFFAMHWSMAHEAGSMVISSRTGAACDLASIAQNQHGRVVAKRIYETLEKSPFARRTILSTGTAMMETGMSIYMYGKAIIGEVQRSHIEAANIPSEEYPEDEEPVFTHQEPEA